MLLLAINARSEVKVNSESTEGSIKRAQSRYISREA